MLINENTTNFDHAFGQLSTAQINWKPNSKTWSIGQVISHLIKTNESYFTIPTIFNSTEYKPSFLVKIRIVPKIIGNLILKSVDPNTQRKVKTMEVFEPVKSNFESEILDEFKKSQQQLHNMINENENLILAKTIIPSPVNKHIIYHFDTVIDIIVNHQKRHYNQAMNVLSIMKVN